MTTQAHPDSRRTDLIPDYRARRNIKRIGRKDYGVRNQVLRHEFTRQLINSRKIWAKAAP